MEGDGGHTMNDLYKHLNNLSEAQRAFILSGVFAILEESALHVEIVDYIEREVNFFKEANHAISKR